VLVCSALLWHGALWRTALLAEAGVDSSDCVEKEELVQKVVVRLGLLNFAPLDLSVAWHASDGFWIRCETLSHCLVRELLAAIACAENDD
jgi:hypothetical protein